MHLSVRYNNGLHNPLLWTSSYTDDNSHILVMKQKAIFEAVVTVQGARLQPQDLVSPKATARDNLLVHVLVMVPKGDKDVTVPTNCLTQAKRRTLEPIWNETFAIPVLPRSDVLVFRVHKDEFIQAHSNNISNTSCIGNGEVENEVIPEIDPSAVGDVDGRRMVGLCLLPVAAFNPSGLVTHHCLEIFPRPNEPGVGHLFVAAKIRRASINLLEIHDLKDPTLRKQYHASRLSAVQARFLGIGELAAFLFEEGYSHDMSANWNRALTLLAEQLAYRIYATTDSSDDDANFVFAKKKVEQDGGLWDGV